MAFARRVPVGPARLDHHGSGQGIACPGDAPTPGRTTAGVFTWNEPQPGHQLTRVCESGDIADFCGQRCGDGRVHAPQCSQRINDRSKPPRLHGIFDSEIECPNTFADLVNGALQLLKRKLLMRVAEPAQFIEPAPMDLRPVCRPIIAKAMTKQKT